MSLFGKIFEKKQEPVEEKPLGEEAFLKRKEDEYLRCEKLMEMERMKGKLGKDEENELKKLKERLGEGAPKEREYKKAA